MKLSVIIPCYNELETIESIVNAVKAAQPEDKEIIIVDDCSTDGTREIIRNSIESSVDKVIYHNKNQGKGGAVRSGFGVARGDLIVIQDADLEYDPEEYRLLMDPILSNKADVVYGSRFMGAAPHRVVFFWHYVGNKFLTLFSNMMTNINLTDMETCFKMMRKEVTQSLTIEENGFGIEPELTAKIAKGGWRIYEVGISYSGRTYAEGKKISWKDGIRAFWAIIKYNVFR